MEKIFTTYWFWSDLLDYLLWNPKAHSLLFLTVDDLIYFFLFVKCCLSFIKLFNLLLDLFLRLKKKETSLISHKERAVGLVEEGGRRTGEGVSAKGAYCPSATLWADNSSAPTPAGPSFKSVQIKSASSFSFPHRNRNLSSFASTVNDIIQTDGLIKAKIWEFSCYVGEKNGGPSSCLG